MFCILSIFIVFIADAEFPKAYTQNNNNNKCCIIDLLFGFFLFKLKRDTRFLSESKCHIYFRSTKYHKGCQGVNKTWKTIYRKKKPRRVWTAGGHVQITFFIFIQNSHVVFTQSYWGLFVKSSRRSRICWYATCVTGGHSELSRSGLFLLLTSDLWPLTDRLHLDISSLVCSASLVKSTRWDFTHSYDVKQIKFPSFQRHFEFYSEQNINTNPTQHELYDSISFRWTRNKLFVQNETEATSETFSCTCEFCI